MLAQRLRHCVNIKTTLGQIVVFAGFEWCPSHATVTNNRVENDRFWRVGTFSKFISPAPA